MALNHSNIGFKYGIATVVMALNHSNICFKYVIASDGSETLKYWFPSYFFFLKH
jgi:hypothetical protein